MALQALVAYPDLNLAPHVPGLAPLNRSVVGPNLRAFWRLNTHILDLSGFGNDGATLDNQAALSSVDGRPAMVLDGTGDSLTVPHNSRYNLSSGDFTVLVSVFVGSAAGFRAVIGKGDTAGSEWMISLNNASNMRWYQSGTIATTSQSIIAGTWYQVGVSRRANSIQIYINGEPDGSGTSSRDHTTTKALTLGGADGSASRWWLGAIEWAGIWVGEGFNDAWFGNVFRNPDMLFEPARILVPVAGAGATAGITGTATSSITESDVVTGGKTIIITLTGDTWKAAGTGPIGSTADTQAIIDGLDSAQSEGTGWNAEVRDKEVTTAVVRTSATVATITLTAQAAYDITAQETITVTVPTTALVTGAAAITATPTFTVDLVAAGVLYYSGLSLMGVGV